MVIDPVAVSHPGWETLSHLAWPSMMARAQLWNLPVPSTSTRYLPLLNVGLTLLLRPFFFSFAAETPEAERDDELITLLSSGRFPRLASSTRFLKRK